MEERGTLVGRIKKNIKEVQRKDAKTKKKWVVLLSSLSMLVVIVVWLAYLNLTIPALETKKKETKTSFFSVLGRGFEIVGGDLGRGVERISGGLTKTAESVKIQLEKRNEFNVEGRKKTFTTSTQINN